VRSAAAAQPTPSGHPVLAWLRQQPHPREGASVLTAQHTATSTTLLSGGLWCFLGAKIVCAQHEPVATGARPL
jgi:hypothetical protein